MFAILLTYVVIIFSILGLTCCIEYIWLYFIHPKNSPKRSIIINLDKNYARSQLYEILEELKWKGDNKIQNIIVVNKNLECDDFLNLKNEYQNKRLIFIDKLEINNWTP